MVDTQYDMTELGQVRSRAMQLKRDYSRRNDQNTADYSTIGWKWYGGYGVMAEAKRREAT